MTTFDAARVDRACRRFVDAALAAERPVDLRRHLELWDAPAEMDVPGPLSRARLAALQEGATVAARLGAHAIVKPGMPNRFARRRKEAKGRA